MRWLPAIALIGVGCYCSLEQSYRHYEHHTGAVVAGEVERGWLPSWVPLSATDIHLQSDIDTNAIWLRFRLGSVDRQVFQSSLLPLSADEVQRIAWHRPCGTARWWPRNLIQQQPADDIALNGELFKRNDPGRFFIAFEGTTDNVYIWSQRR